MLQTTQLAAKADLNASAPLYALVEAAKLSNTLPRYVAVEGPIGVGKTTLARQLATLFGYPLMLEGADENPFLDRFYAEGASQALPTQLFFFSKVILDLRLPFIF